MLDVLQDGQSVSLEPGGQFELSGAPLDTLHQTCAEVNSHLYQVQNHLMPSAFQQEFLLTSYTGSFFYSQTLNTTRSCPKSFNPRELQGIAW